MLRQSSILLVSMFHNLMFSEEAANKNSLFSSKVKFVIGDESIGGMFMFENYSKSQYFTVLSVDPFARARLAGLYSRQVTLYPGKKKFATTFPVVTSHTFTAPSLHPEATHLESGDSPAQVTAPVCSLKVKMFWFPLILKSHTLTFVSSEPEMSTWPCPREPSVKHNAEVLWPLSFIISFCVVRSHTCTVPPIEPE